jgi:hypothetical protein
MAENASPERSDSLGVFSLKAAAWGFLLPILFVLLLIALRVDLAPEDRARVTRLLILLFGGMEVIALLTGLVAWPSRAGKTGVLLALVLLVGGLIYAAVELNWIGRGREAQPVAEAARAAGPAAPASSAPRPAAPAVSPSAEAEPASPAEPPRRRSPGELFPNVPPKN